MKSHLQLVKRIKDKDGFNGHSYFSLLFHLLSPTLFYAVDPQCQLSYINFKIQSFFESQNSPNSEMNVLYLPSMIFCSDTSPEDFVCFSFLTFSFYSQIYLFFILFVKQIKSPSIYLLGFIIFLQDSVLNFFFLFLKGIYGSHIV